MYYTYLLLFQYKLYLQYTMVRVWYTMPLKLKSTLFYRPVYSAKQDRYTLIEQSVGLSNWMFY